MPTETQRRIDSVMLALNCLRREGLIPLTAPISPAAMAFLSEELGEPVSKATFHRETRRALLHARLALTAHLTNEG
jgi:hypothetical protein